MLADNYRAPSETTAAAHAVPLHVLRGGHAGQAGGGRAFVDLDGIAWTTDLRAFYLRAAACSQRLRSRAGRTLAALVSWPVIASAGPWLLRGMSVDRLRYVAETFGDRTVRPLPNAALYARLAALHGSLVGISALPQVLVQTLRWPLEVERVLAPRLEVRAGRLTGRLLRPEGCDIPPGALRFVSPRDIAPWLDRELFADLSTVGPAPWIGPAPHIVI